MYSLSHLGEVLRRSTKVVSGYKGSLALALCVYKASCSACNYPAGNKMWENEACYEYYDISSNARFPPGTFSVLQPRCCSLSGLGFGKPCSLPACPAVRGSCFLRAALIPLANIAQ